jgi:hypothetical protein
MSIACRPPECQAISATLRVSVGFWDEYELTSFSPGAGVYASVFWRILYSPTMCGRLG